MSIPLRVLIVEDSVDDTALLLRALRRGGYEVVSERVETAEDMNAALEHAEWDIILSDYTMPRFNAPHALDVLKNRRLDIPFILVSGTIGEETAVNAMKAGAHDFLIKGNLARLIPALERELREAHSRRERRQADAALRQSEERFRQIAETIDEVFWIADSNITRMLYISPAYERVWGRSIASLYENPKSFLDSVHTDDRERVLADLEVQKTGLPFDHEYRIVYSDGTARWIWDRGRPVRDKAGRVVRYVGVAVDITERKLSEVENARLALVVNSSDDAIFSVTRDEVIATWNAGAERTYGYTAEEIKGKHFSTLIPEEHRPDLAAIREKLNRGEALVHYEHENQRKDGSRLYVTLTLSPIRDAKGFVTGVSTIARDITERKRAEAEILFKTTLLEAQSETTIDGILVVDRTGRILLANQQFARMWNVPEETIRSRDDHKVIEKAAPQVVNAGAFLEKLNYLYSHEGEKSRDEIEFRDGRFFDRYSSPLQDPTGKLYGRIWYFRDISVRRRAETALRESEATLRLFVQHAPAAIAMLDREMRYLVVSQRWMTDYRLGNRDILGLSHYEVFPEVPDHWKEVHRDCLAGRVARCDEESFLRPDGKLDWVRWEIRPWRKIDDSIGGIIIFSELITHRKTAEAEKARLVTAIEQSAEGVMMTSTSGDIEYVNPAFTHITGFSRDEVLGQNPRILKSGKQDPTFYKKLWTTILKGEIWRGEIVNRRKDGKHYIEELNIAPVREASGKVTHFIATKKDVTERKLLEEQFRQAQKMEAVGRLAGGVAHDFNNLLTVINGYSEMVLGGLPSNDRARIPLEEINKAGAQAASLTHQLLAFSRQQVLAPQVLDLNPLVADMEKMLRRLIGEDVDLAMVQDTGLGQVKADPGQVHQIVANLAVNARDAMPHGGKLTIETSNAEFDSAYAQKNAIGAPGRYVMLAVSDTGIGMDAETQARIFEPFFTTKEEGKGTGLGLAMVYGTVKQSGGFILVYSEPGRGTTLKIYLPRVEEEGKSLQQPESREPTARGAETILLVEDNEAVRAMAKRTLQNFGYKVIESISPEDALQIGERYQEPIDLLLTDVVLPRMSGPKVAEHLARLRPGLKVLFMSGYTNNALLHQGVLEAAKALLQKPFTPSSLGRKVREVLDAHQDEKS
jgi:PAS domain S-box-containing protein